MTQVAKRGRGRPKGSKNKNRLLSGATVAQICEYHKFNPTSFLAAVANGTEDTEQWTKDDRLRAASKLHDSIHHNKNVGAIAQGEVLDGQFSLVFVEDTESFSLPGQTDAARTEKVVRGEQVQRAGDPPQSWEDSICD